ncbi:cell wall hydrolase [Mesobacillus maritimus]|uniref:Cell wall hydrolase n=1 Tax=Mesobacillus maritimus TaxID=1643336 RepID=A0ABS7KB70_9BACI|nr:cell wall hydrolase [Mesobacillus maritimus]
MPCKITFRNRIPGEQCQALFAFYDPAREIERKLAQKVVKFWRQHPSMYALWYFNPYAACPPTWYGQPFSGQYKQHCYYEQ